MDRKLKIVEVRVVPEQIAEMFISNIQLVEVKCLLSIHLISHRNAVVFPSKTEITRLLTSVTTSIERFQIFQG